MRLSTIFLLLLYISGYSQDAFKFINYTTINGLADNRVSCITQDKRGFMWFGTGEGLSRFDGNKFENYFADPNNKSSLPDNNVNYIHEYKPGHLLILSGSTLCCLNTLTREFYSTALKGKNIFGVSQTAKGEYVLSSTDTSYILNKNLEITDILLSPLKKKGENLLTWNLDDSFILCGSVGEYYLYNKNDKKYILLIAGADIPGKEKTMIFRYYDPKKSQLWFSSYFGGIYIYDLNGKVKHKWTLDDLVLPFHNGNISFIVPKNDSIMWIGNAEEDGLLVLNLKTNRFSAIRSNPTNPVSLSGNSLYANFTDNDGNEWIGTSKGLSKINRTTFTLKKWDATEIAPPDVNSPFLAIRKGVDGNFYTGRFGHGGIWKINKDDNSFKDIKTMPGVGLWCLDNFDKNIIVTGGGTTIMQYDPFANKTSTSDFLKQYFPQSDIVVTAFKHSNGDEWYSGNAGGGFVRISVKDKSIHQYKKDGPNGNFFVSYYPYHVEDKNGDLWFGVNKSSFLLHWNMQTDRFNEINFAEINKAGRRVFKGITELCIDRNNNIWVGFDGTGVLKYDPVKNETTHYTISNGLASDYIGSMTFDDKDRLWIGTYKGLTCLITKENKLINFTKEDGLADDYFAERCILFDSATHQLWIGGASALMRFDPDELLQTGSRKFPVYIDAITVNNELFVDQYAGNSLFKPGQNNIQFTFIGLDPEGVKNIEYSYQLVGADKDWVNSSNTTATYNNLGSGKYEFIVRARHKGDTGWMTLQDPFRFTIETPWFKTWWFRLLVAAVLTFFAWLLIRTYYRNQFLRQKAMMEKELAIEQERSKMARELHDGLGSMLSGIKHSFTAMTKQFDLNDNQKLLFHTNLDKLNESIIELRNISHNMSSDALLKYGLENSLRDYCNNASLNFGIPVSFTAIDTKDLNINEEKSVHIFRIIQELFQNIIKHSEAKNVVVQLSCHNARVYVTVEDDGKGFDIATIKKKEGIGLKNIESRIKLLKGDLDYKTSPGKGTSVMMSISLD